MSDEHIGLRAKGDFETELNREWLDEPLGEDEFEAGVQIQASFDGGRKQHFTVYGERLENEPVIELRMEEGKESFLAEDLLISIVYTIGVCTMDVVRWTDYANVPTNRKP